MTLREALTSATATLAQNGHLSETAARDAALLLLQVLEVPRSTLFSDPGREISAAQSARFQAAIARRLTLEPIQYITGSQEFYGLDFEVTQAVLIPRPETELLVEAVLSRLPDRLPVGRPLRIADVGTGSGIIAVTLAVNLPNAQITAVDISPEALAIARRNAQKHQVADRITFLECDLLAAYNGERFDAICSNPPYIPTSDLASLHPQVSDHEPHLALFAGSRGLDMYERLIPQARSALKPGGLLALEIGYGQQDAIAELLAQWKDLCFLSDLQGIPRTALAYR